jgi:phospholipid/cholesterol/gamma-HCH transport system substrate-binding protein
MDSMKISNETKVGILTIVALAFLIIGFNFLKGKNIFTKEKHLYAVFGDLGSLKKSNEVKINGLPVGIVYDYTELDKELTGIIVTITLKRDVNIPKNSVATIESELLGGAFINIAKGTLKEYLVDGDTLVTDLASSLLGDVKAQINPTLGKIREAIDSLKMVLSGVSNLFEKDTKGNITEVIANLKDATASLKTLLQADGGPLSNTLNNVASFTGNLKKNNDSITAAINSIKKTADNFSSLEIQPTIDTLQATVAELRKLLESINSSQGSLSKLMNDPALYNNLNDALLAAEILMDDIRVHPKRYTTILTKKVKTEPLTSPSKKDTVPQGPQK